MAARLFLRRFGAFGVLLMALTAVLPSSEAIACAPGQPTSETASIQTAFGVAAPIGSDGCQDCGLACIHGCCHASHVAIPNHEVSPVTTPVRFLAAPAWTHVVGEPFGAPDGPERPPRA